MSTPISSSVALHTTQVRSADEPSAVAPATARGHLSLHFGGNSFRSSIPVAREWRMRRLLPSSVDDHVADAHPRVRSQRRGVRHPEMYDGLHPSCCESTATRQYLAQTARMPREHVCDARDEPTDLDTRPQVGARRWGEFCRLQRRTGVTQQRRDRAATHHRQLRRCAQQLEPAAQGQPAPTGVHRDHSRQRTQHAHPSGRLPPSRPMMDRTALTAPQCRACP